MFAVRRRNQVLIGYNGMTPFTGATGYTNTKKMQQIGVISLLKIAVARWHVDLKQESRPPDSSSDLWFGRTLRRRLAAAMNKS